MGIFDSLVSRAPGVIGQGLKGRNEGQVLREAADQRARAQAIQEQQLKRQIERDALEMALRQAAEDRQREMVPFMQDWRAAQTGKANADTGLVKERTVTEPVRRENIQAQMGKTIAQTVTEGERPALVRAQTSRALRPPAAGSGVTGGEGGGRGLTSGSATAISDMRALLNVTRDAQKAFTSEALGDANPTGLFAGPLAKVGARTGTNKTATTVAHSRLANIATALGKLRSGGAITPQEYERLEGLIPHSGQDEQVVRDKLTELDRYLSMYLKEKIDTFGESGYDVSGVRRDGVAPSAGGAPAGDDIDAWAAARVAAKRKKPQ
jgi:hypothetical protein